MKKTKRELYHLFGILRATGTQRGLIIRIEQLMFFGNENMRFLGPVKDRPEDLKVVSPGPVTLGPLVGPRPILTKSDLSIRFLQ
jgi:hypothetical protein